MKKYRKKHLQPALKQRANTWNPFRSSKNISGRKKGFIIILVLVSLIVASMFAGVMIRQSMMTEKQSERELNHIQANWLVESGIERAFNQMRSNQDYAGETWKITESELNTDEPAEVLISIDENQEEEKSRQLVVKATYPVNSVFRSVISKTIPLNIE